MKDVLLSGELMRQAKWLRFDRTTESEFQDSASAERIRRIQIVVVIVFLIFVLPPPVGELASTPLLKIIGLATKAAAVLMLAVAFVPNLRKGAVFALPVWEVAQHAALASVFPNPQPYSMAAMQMVMSVIIVAAVRSPAKLSLAYVAISLAIWITTWNLRGLSSPDYFVATSLLCIGLIFLIVGSYLTEVADRRSFLVARLLEVERARTQALLTNVLPAEVAEKLKNSSDVIASSHPAISVLFADVVNFTPFAAERPPNEVVGFLNDLFSRFDALVERSGLEKIKTVGDAYMVAGGVPSFRPDHLEAMADLALEMRGAVAAIGAEVRFGLHTGPALAGVIGTKRYMYDIWGETVNFAARLESTGRPGEIQVSQEVRDALIDTHEFRERGTIDLKGLGPKNVFVLLRRTVVPVTVT